MSAALKGCTSKVNTVEKWKESLKADWLEYDVDDKDNNVVRLLQCKFCSSKEERIISAKNFHEHLLSDHQLLRKSP